MSEYEEIEKKLLKGKIEVMTKSAFISSICLSVKHIITDKVPTAATNHTTIMYNPEFVKNLNVSEMAGLIAHECWHIAFMHIHRRNGRDPLLWNVAGDYLINWNLIQNGFSLPAGGLYDSKYTNEWSTDEIYDDLHTNSPDFDPGDGFMLDIDEDPDVSEEEKATQQEQITDILVKAHTQAIAANQDPGNLPGEIARIIDDIINPKLPWNVLLQRFLNRRIKSDLSWSKRNRRFSNIYLPSRQGYGLGHIVVAIDTSGSVNNDELKEMLSEINGIQQVFNPEKLTVIDCDMRINNVYEVDGTTDILSLKFTGGGGTRFQPVLDYVEDLDIQALIYFTDLYGEAALDPVDYPIMWICNSEHEPMNIGETVYIN